MPDNIKNDRYFAEGFRELDESLAETTAMLADALPLDADLRSLVPWQEGKTFPESIPAGAEREGAQLLPSASNSSILSKNASPGSSAAPAAPPMEPMPSKASGLP